MTVYLHKAAYEHVREDTAGKLDFVLLASTWLVKLWLAIARRLFVVSMILQLPSS